MLSKIGLIGLILLSSSLSVASSTLDLAGYISAWRCTNLQNQGCQASGSIDAQNFTVYLRQFGAEWRGEHSTHYDISGYRLTATYKVFKIDFHPHYKIDVYISVRDPKGDVTEYQAASTNLEVGKTLSPFEASGRVFKTDNVEIAEKLTPVVKLGSSNERFSYVLVSPDKQ